MITLCNRKSKPFLQKVSILWLETPWRRSAVFGGEPPEMQFRSPAAPGLSAISYLG
jgi:hypothetical protein